MEFYIDGESEVEILLFAEMRSTRVLVCARQYHHHLPPTCKRSQSSGGNRKSDPDKDPYKDLCQKNRPLSSANGLFSETDVTVVSLCDETLFACFGGWYSMYDLSTPSSMGYGGSSLVNLS